MRIALALVLALEPSLAPDLVQAHSVISPSRVAAGVDTRFEMRVGHGCDGAATQEFRVSLPETAQNVRPVARRGWSVGISRGADGRQEIVWLGNLPDERVGFFAFMAEFAPTDAPAELIARQNCEGGASMIWDGSADHPAPTVVVE